MVLGTVIYIVVFFLVTSDGLTYYNVGPLLLTGVLWNVLLLIVGVLVIIDSTRKLDAGKTQELLTGVFVVKLVAIPFFLINFALMVLLAFAGSLIFILGGMVLIAIAVNSIGLTSALRIDEPYSPALVDRLAERLRAGGRESDDNERCRGCEHSRTALRHDSRCLHRAGRGACARLLGGGHERQAPDGIRCLCVGRVASSGVS